MSRQLDCNDAPIITYPCCWLYKVICPDQEKARLAIAEIVRDDPHTILFSSASSGGKYHCLNLEVKVTGEEHRNSIYLALKGHSDVKVVL